MTTITVPALKILPVTGALGAEVHGVDLSGDLDDDVVKTLRIALLDHLVLFFRDQPLTPPQLLALGRRFGKLHIHPIVKAMDAHPAIIEVIKEAEETGNWGDDWHTDLIALPEPPLGSILYAKDVPQFSGDTQFMNMYLAYETLSAPLRTLLDGLTCLCENDVDTYGKQRSKAMATMDGAGSSRAIHPLVRTHPETGRKSLYMSRPRRMRINEMSRQESEALLAFLNEHAGNPDFACRFQWRQHSIAFWDNRCTRHRVTADYFYAQRGFSPHRRHMQRVTIEGDVPR